MAIKWKIHELFYFLGLVCFLQIDVTFSGRVGAPARMTKIRCPSPENIPNGSFRLRKQETIMRVSCRPGFELQGPKTIDCVHGKWYGRKPVCAKRGCAIDVPNPEHGQIQMDNDLRMVLFCLNNYNLAGNRFAFCNGTHWDRPIGNCREPSFDVQYECDFETEDICGWTIEEAFGTEWKRAMAGNIYTSFHTGPRHDHTTMSASDGHYMLMETIRPTNMAALLISPVFERELSLKTACCFRFFYFMYGSGVGDLGVFVRPISVDMTKMLKDTEKYQKFIKSGNQNNMWNEGYFNIEEMDEDFQIVFSVSSAKSHLSDIAIDDVKLMMGEDCQTLNRANGDEDGSFYEPDEATEETLFDTQTCAGRCFESVGSGFVRKNGKLFGYCNCNIDCEDDESCCPDFRSVCLSEIFAQSTEVDDETLISSSKIITKKDTETTTEMQTTSKEETTTTPTTSTTTTRKIITRRTTAKRTTPSTTRTTTTTTTKTTTTTTPKTTTTTKRTTTTSTTPKATTTTTTTTSTTPKPITKPTTTSSTTTPTPTPKPTTTTTRKIVFTKPTATTSTSTTTSSGKNFNEPVIHGKETIVSWEIDNSTREYHSNASRFLLIVLVLIIVIVLVSVAYKRYKGHLRTFFTKNDHNSNASGNGTIETTSIRAKFLPKSYNFRPNASTTANIKRSLGMSSRNEDMTSLIDDDNDLDNDGCFDNESTNITNKATSLSTNL